MDTAQSATYNPFLTTSTLADFNATSFVYEPLLQFDILRPGVTYPWLATSSKWSDDDRVLTFQLRPNVDWSDGVPFTSADVVFTFDLIKRYPALNTTGIQFSAIKAIGSHAVEITFAHPAYTQFYSIAGETYIVPEHLWKSVRNPEKFADSHPVGTGPYLLSSLTPEELVLMRNPHYWQPGLPKIEELKFPIASFTAAAVALGEGQYDWASGFFVDIQKIYGDKSPYNHYWFPAEGVNAIYPNETVWPLNNVAVRKAISLAVDRHQISSEGEYGYEPPVTNATGLILPSDASYLVPAYKSATLTENVAEARRLLAAAGFRKGPNGFLVGTNGKAVSLTLIDPAGDTDYITDDQIISVDLRRIGIKVTVSTPSYPAWAGDLATGHFDMAIDGSDVGPSPYVGYDGWLDDSLSAPVGKTAVGDYERWDNPATQRYLAAYQKATTNAQRASAIQGIEGVMVNDLPVIPLVYSVAWGEYRTNKVTGWPSAADPYEPVSIYPPESEVVLLHLRPVH